MLLICLNICSEHRKMGVASYALFLLRNLNSGVEWTKLPTNQKCINYLTIKVTKQLSSDPTKLLQGQLQRCLRKLHRKVYFDGSVYG